MDNRQYTTQEITYLSQKLTQRLGPEYVASRPGPGGAKVYYLEGWKAMNLANEVFGFNGWSSNITEITIDFVDEVGDGRVSIGVSAIVKVFLRDGTFHEDIGYGNVDNAKSKAQAFAKAKKEAITDATKRALKTFGNIMGNCMYDKNYLQQIQKMKAPPIHKIEIEELHRAPIFVLPPPIPETLGSFNTKTAVKTQTANSDIASTNINAPNYSTTLKTSNSSHLNGKQIMPTNSGLNNPMAQQLVSFNFTPDKNNQSNVALKSNASPSSHLYNKQIANPNASFNNNHMSPQTTFNPNSAINTQKNAVLNNTLKPSLNGAPFRSSNTNNDHIVHSKTGSNIKYDMAQQSNSFNFNSTLNTQRNDNLNNITSVKSVPLCSSNANNNQLTHPNPSSDINNISQQLVLTSNPSKSSQTGQGNPGFNNNGLQTSVNSVPLCSSDTHNNSSASLNISFNNKTPKQSSSLSLDSTIKCNENPALDISFQSNSTEDQEIVVEDEIGALEPEDSFHSNATIDMDEFFSDEEILNTPFWDENGNRIDSRLVLEGRQRERARRAAETSPTKKSQPSVTGAASKRPNNDGDSNAPPSINTNNNSHQVIGDIGQIGDRYTNSGFGGHLSKRPKN
ncbi:hypothetical protein G9A89_018251 [Geosiphon pyriformis]|nr:hypothetical protein G9A89_018251 [Geosiphon pyriformis]